MKQIKNHWDNTKAEWKVWNKRKEKETGLGWDYVKNTIAASDEWWDEYMQGVPDVAKFRDKGIEHLDLLNALFEGTTATGEAAWAPSQGVLPEDTAGPCQLYENISIGNNEDNLEDMFVEAHDANNIGDSDVPDLRPDHGGNGNEHASLHRKRSSSNATQRERRRRSNGNTNKEDYLKQLCSAVELKSGSKERSEYEECLNILIRWMK